MTKVEHQSGTDRIAEIAAGLSADIIVNVQGDEPEMEPEHIRLVADLLERHPWAGFATLCVPGSAAEQANPNNVKVVFGSGERGAGSGDAVRERAVREGRALWFSRAPVIYDRDAGGLRSACLRHLGIYAYRRDVLLRFAALPVSPLERTEKLEQLRALEHGIGIACAVVDHAVAGIDVRSDYDAFLARRLSSPPLPVSRFPLP